MPRGYEKKSCSTQVRMKFKRLITNKMLKNIHFSCFITLKSCIIQLMNVKMPTIVGILTFMSRINFMFS